ncbi:hypothetical protein WICPIJ_009308 [Wickerhamomyces pijperi]|uniref:Uncharacterized protein n=1 Tax=Wickerhamomyces pijperi TaxID=599730 RepID=A0A9P8PQ76_WICPI|nr:hypothetical protein WICPIJ_009308 [Wickerhamomyces pijperi]
MSDDRLTTVVVNRTNSWRHQGREHHIWSDPSSIRHLDLWLIMAGVERMITNGIEVRADAVVDDDVAAAAEDDVDANAVIAGCYAVVRSSQCSYQCLASRGSLPNSADAGGPVHVNFESVLRCWCHWNADIAQIQKSSARL